MERKSQLPSRFFCFLRPDAACFAGLNLRSSSLGQSSLPSPNGMLVVEDY